MKQFIFFLLAAPLISSAQVADSTQRQVVLEGAVNFRDVGGYRTAGGKQVMWGKVYRSADISKLTDRDMNVLAERHIYSVVDLRENAEIRKAPDRLLPHADYVSCPVTEGTTDWVKQMQGLTTGDSLMAAFYGRTETFGKKYRPMFRKLLTLPDSSALVYHCSAGKDRTGIGTALFLHALGVPAETILEDYLASNVYRQKENENLVKHLSLSMNVSPQVAKDMASAKTQFLKTTFDTINRQYGSVNRFLKKELGIGKKERKLLQRKYTFDPATARG